MSASWFGSREDPTEYKVAARCIAPHGGLPSALKISGEPTREGLTEELPYKGVARPESRPARGGKFMPPPRGASDRSNPRPACAGQGSNAGGADCTTRFVNAHRTVCRELLYRLHPWFGRDVFIHAAIDKAEGAVFRCTEDGLEVERGLEIPAWMFDRAACASGVCISADPFVGLEGLEALSALLSLALKTDAPSSNARLWDAYGISREQNRGETHDKEDGGVSDRGSAQTAPHITADGFVCKATRGRRARLVRPAERFARGADRPDDAADPRACAGDGDANNGRGRP